MGQGCPSFGREPAVRGARFLSFRYSPFASPSLSTAGLFLAKASTKKKPAAKRKRPRWRELGSGPTGRTNRKKPADAIHDKSYNWQSPESQKKARYLTQQKKRQETADIGEIPEIANKRRRAKCKKNLKVFFETYLAGHFPLPWSPHHLQMFRAIQECILHDGCQIMILPRGSGKTTVMTFAAMWAALYGHRQFLMFCPGNGDAAPEFLSTVTGELIQNDLILEDFPEVAYPFVQSEGLALRANHQTTLAKPTGLKLGKFLRFPLMKENAKAGNSGVILKAKGFLGSIRGNVAHLPTGETIRPDFFLIDDPQTSASAWSLTETDKRRNLLTKDIMRSAGPGRSPAAFCTATVIQKNDLADQMCNEDSFAQWNVIRVSMMENWPKAKETLWNTYAELRKSDLKEGRKGENATKFYEQNRKEMDAGAKVYWPERIDPGRASAIESAMARWMDDPEAFASEDQNDPLAAVEDSSDLLIRPEDVVNCIGEYKRGTVQDDVEKLTAFIDVSAKCLWWMVVGFTSRFEGRIVEYGVYPAQPIRHVTLATVKKTLRQQYGGTMEEAVTAGLKDLIDLLMETRWKNRSGEELSIDRGHVDAKWGATSGQVKDVVWNSNHSSIWFPCEGIAIRASSRDLNDTAKKKQRREVRGVHWRISPERRGLRVIADSNHWKSFAARRIKAKSLLLPAGSEIDHSMLIDQLQAEYPVEVEGRGRKVEEWKTRGGVWGKDEHFWDCLYNCHVIASTLGIQIEGQQSGPRTTRKGTGRRSFKDRTKRKAGW